jgi:type IV secretion system protein VirB8
MNTKKTEKNTRYFDEACHWADDRFGTVEASKNRYRAAFVGAMVLSTTLSIAIAAMMPLKQTQPLLIHHYDNGITTAERVTEDALTVTHAQIESDLVRYVVNRESFDVTSYRAQFELINLLSANSVVSDYEQSQRKTNPDSPLNQLGTQSSRRVHVYSISFIDQDALNDKEKKKRFRNHHDLAEVVFATTDKNKASGAEVEHHFTALISWRYLGMPASPDARWKNFNGFEVTRYSIQQRNV